MSVINSLAQRRILQLESLLQLSNDRLRVANKENKRLLRVALGIENIVRELNDEMQVSNMLAA